MGAVQPTALLYLSLLQLLSSLMTLPSSKTAYHSTVQTRSFYGNPRLFYSKTGMTWTYYKKELNQYYKEDF